MEKFVRSRDSGRVFPWRFLGWGAAVVLLAAPFVAMRMHAEGVDWSLGDFIFAGVLFAVIGGGFELAVWASPNRSYRAAAALALLGTLLVIWVNLAVGIVGSEHNPPNTLFFAVLLVGLVGACAGRFRAAGMSIAMLGTAVGLWGAFALAAMRPTDEPFVRHSVEFAGTSIFAMLFLGSAALFRKAVRDESGD
jgi:hypothetical protein